MLDYFNTKLPGGFPDHPHRGFETVTYLKEGSIYHEDFKGNKGILAPGDIQWMTAGKGICHAEMPGKFDEITKGFQLWLNLDKKHKYEEAGYQEYRADQLPLVQKDGIKIKLIAGETYGEKGPIKARTPAYFMDVQIDAGKNFEQIIPKQWVCLLFLYQGSGDINGKKVDTNQAVLFNQENNEQIEIKSGNEGCHLMLMAGKPIGEPIIQYGPFVVTSQEELYQTFEDYEECKNGFEYRKGWASKIQHMANRKK
ncbi:RmlC-like cupin domain [Pseudocohnilembus persalinus]|uniref:RmlC-like cupin domain n=1 Tax=Pseudocohnilembus persalinus TaxID=266149 RepID=A0A0V0QQH9_PSEPJ|nr:RmlC-like cupin domain [Pseudocohnilembus persalinus]|eukprot:KRX04460.1 RmlC-like cupin domain [Pseudocohnilembus persalinus]